MSYIVTPNLRRTSFLATFVAPVSHHDPSKKGSANITSFLRRKQVVERTHTKIPSQEQVDSILNQFPVPDSLIPIFSELTVPEFLATVAVQQVIRLYNGKGLLDGKERYARLQSRAEFNATRSATMYAWWGGMVRDLQGDSPYAADEQIGRLISMPSALAQLVFAELIDNAASAVMLARLWSETNRDDPATRIEFPSVAFSDSNRVSIQVPAFSANSARHEVVREPGALHMLSALGLRYDDLPDGVAQMLYNGGDLNSSAPSNAFKLTREIRERYPLLSLVGGSTSGFILGASNLEVSAWLVCSENQQALDVFGIQADISAFDLLDQDEHTRHTSKRVEGSPMPFSFETLISGTQVLVDLRLRPYATPLEIGALAAAVDTFFSADGTLGGQSARGYGLLIQQMICEPDHDMALLRKQYDDYLLSNADELRNGLVSATMGTGKALW